MSLDLCTAYRCTKKKGEVCLLITHQVTPTALLKVLQTNEQHDSETITSQQQSKINMTKF